MSNLIENALKYSEEGDGITVEIHDSPSEVRLAVSDEGFGIPAEQVQMIFDRFRRAENAFDQPAKGFGLGLYIVKNLVEAHRGEVDVISEIDKGTTLAVHLPKRAAGAGNGRDAV